MLRVRNGRLETEHVAFAMPEGFCLEQNDLLGMGYLRFISADRKVLIAVAFDKTYGTEEQELNTLLQDGDLIRTSDFLRIRRGVREGVGVFYRNGTAAEEYYGEAYAFPEEKGANQFFVYVLHCRGGEKDEPSLKEILGSPNVKSFFDSIEYR